MVNNKGAGEMDELGLEERGIERRYRRAVFMAVVLFIGGMIWAIAKIMGAHYSMTVP